MGILRYYEDPDALDSRFREEDAWPYAPSSRVPGVDSNVPPAPMPSAGAAGANVLGPPLSLLPSGPQVQGQASPALPRPQMAQDPYRSAPPMGGLTQSQFDGRFNAAAGGANPTRILQSGMPPTGSDASRFEGQQFDSQTYAPSGGSLSWLQNVSPDNPASNESQKATTSPTGPLDRKYTDTMKEKFERFAPKAKWDVRQWTNGYGTEAAGPNEEINEATAEQRFQRKIKEVAAHVDRFKPNLPPGARAALIDLTYNAGSNWMKSGLGEFVRAGDWENARERFLQYNKVWNAKTKKLEVHPHQVERRTIGASWFPGQAQDPQQQQVQPSPQLGANPIPFVNMRQSVPAQRGSIDFSRLQDALQASGRRQIFLGR